MKKFIHTETYFLPFRERVIGHRATFRSPYGIQGLVYADWIGSGRLYQPIEEKMVSEIGPFVANTHTETTETGKLMTRAYQYAHKRIKELVHAGPHDVILTTGYGMTGAIVKFQRILGLKICGNVKEAECLKEEERPVVFVTHMEHHSNQTSWYETMADVVVIQPGEDLLVDLNRLEEALIKYSDRKLKIGSFTACSNVTGIRTPVHKMAKLMHHYGGVAFIDYAASAPYDAIDMHPDDKEEQLDAIFFSPHKFLGGPGSSGVLIFNSSLYHNAVPDQPGGGTVDWTNPWGEYKYLDNIELREDGGTPGFLQAIKATLSMELKEQMGLPMMRQREDELVQLAFAELDKIPNLHILASGIRERLGVISFYMPGIHYNLIVQLLSDRFGIQVRGGCACAGTYGHYLLDVSHEKSAEITHMISHGDLSLKPGWVRLSLHPTMTDQEVRYISDALKQIGKNHGAWSNDYNYNRHTNEFEHQTGSGTSQDVKSWFAL
ncbi:MAG: aminotransferase class V-fold PLP-dependent enzyme [Bacteroidales bacterium]|nr:aminotransferase class V-fold PLP-dependent enzyme [Bacteroidales bacterium]